MTDGWWRIKQYAPNTKTGFTVTTIPVGTIVGGETPYWPIVTDYSLMFKWEDGRQQIYPWASIVHAEYQPPTEGAP